MSGGGDLMPPPEEDEEMKLGGDHRQQRTVTDSESDGFSLCSSIIDLSGDDDGRSRSTTMSSPVSDVRCLSDVNF
jgi:hypothetical protein